MIFTTLFVRVAPLVPVVEPSAILTVVLLCSRFTTDVTPPPPGVTYANGASGCNTTCGVNPVFKETEATTQGFTVDVELKQVWVVSLASKSTMNPMLVRVNGTAPRCVRGSAPTEYGVGG